MPAYILNFIVFFKEKETLSKGANYPIDISCNTLSTHNAGSVIKSLPWSLQWPIFGKQGWALGSCAPPPFHTEMEVPSVAAKTKQVHS